MNCRKCGSKMFIDYEVSQKSTYEVVCLGCSARVYVDKSGVLGKWLSKNQNMLVTGTG